MPTYMLRTRVKPAKLALYKMHHAMVWHCVEEGLRKIAGLTRLQIWAPAAGGPDENCLNMLMKLPGVNLQVAAKAIRTGTRTPTCQSGSCSCAASSRPARG